jgi:hypothetical protein
MFRPSLRERGRFALALAAALCGCAAPDVNAPGWAQSLRADGWLTGAAVAKIPDFRLDGFKVLDNSHLVIYSGADRRHLVSFGTPCPGLLFAQRLGYNAIDGSLGRLDHLIVFSQGGPVACVIDSIQLLEKRAGQTG